MARRRYSREFKLEAVRLVEERGVTVARGPVIVSQGNHFRRMKLERVEAQRKASIPVDPCEKLQKASIHTQSAGCSVILAKFALYSAKTRSSHMRIRRYHQVE